MRPLQIGICLLTVSCVSFAAELLWSPYIQDVRPDRATILWSTRGGSGTGAVRYFSAGGAIDVPSVVAYLPAAKTGLTEDIWLHRAVLLSLQPGTEYRYSILLDGRPVAAAPTQTVKTSGGVPVHFLIIGDTGDNGAGQRTIAESLQRETADFLLHTGDIAYWEGTFQQYQDGFFNIYKDLLVHMPVFTTIGNHDATEGGVPYRTIFAPPQDNVPADARGLYYSFDWANIHFTVLDSNESLSRALAGTGQMLNWLESDLANTRQTWRIVAIHHPPFPTTDYKRSDAICKTVREQLTPIFERYGVHLIISGHEHIYQRTEARRAGVFLPKGPGAIYVTSGGGGSQYYEPGTETFVAAAAGGPHFIRVTVSATAIQMQAVHPDGTRLDLFEMSSAPALLSTAPVVDAASFRPAIAPGGLVSLLGWNLAEREAIAGTPLPVDLAGVSVRAGETKWPLLYASRTQINAQVPFDASGQSTITVSAPTGAVTVTPLLRSVAPAIFSVTIDSRPNAAAIHLDGRLVSSAAPAVPEEWISVYATGLGRVQGNVAAGTSAPASPLYETVEAVRAEIAGRAAESSIACLAPGFVGLYQINVRVPRGVPSGAQTLQLIAGGQSSNQALLEIR